MRFMIPHWEESIQRIDRMPGSTGMAHGRRKIAEMKRAAAVGLQETREEEGEEHFRLTATPTYTTVLTMVWTKTGSAKRTS